MGTKSKKDYHMRKVEEIQMEYNENCLKLGEIVSKIEGLNKHLKVLGNQASALTEKIHELIEEYEDHPKKPEIVPQPEPEKAPEALAETPLGEQIDGGNEEMAELQENPGN